MMKHRALMAGLLVVALICAMEGLAQKEQKPVYEVYAVRYAILPDFPVAGLVKGADRSRKMDIAMMVWLVKGNGRNILVDSGFYRDQFFKQWKVKDFVRPSDALAPLGVKPEENHRCDHHPHALGPRRRHGPVSQGHNLDPER